MILNKIRILKNRILGTSLHRKTKILLINIVIGLFLIIGTTFMALFGLKFDYDSGFLHQEKKLKQLLFVQNIYSSLLTKALRGQFNSSEIENLQQGWQNFLSIQEEKGYGDKIKETYAEIFLSYWSEIQDLIQFEQNLVTKINQKIFPQNQMTLDYLKETNHALDADLQKVIQTRIQVLALNKKITDSLFFVSLVAISILIGIIVLITLLFSHIIITSIKDLHKSLESIVHKKTSELRELNNDLQQRIEQELKESRQKDRIMYQQARLASIGEMIQNIAHQWRQPLNSLILIIQSFKLKFDHNKLSQDFIDSQTNSALRIAKNMSDTIENFRNFFQPHSIKESFNIQKTIEDSLSIFQANLSRNNIDIRIFVPSDLSLFGYENAFTQVILNLVNNAKDAILAEGIPKGVIEIRGKSNDEEIILEILDNAGGIKVQEIDKVFEPYFTTKHKSVGTGVGLYMVKQIIEKQLCGKINAQNQSWISKISDEGYKGASFKIILPLVF